MHLSYSYTDFCNHIVSFVPRLCTCSLFDPCSLDSKLRGKRYLVYLKAVKMVMVIFPKMEDGDFSTEVYSTSRKIMSNGQKYVFFCHYTENGKYDPPQKGLFGEALSHLLYLGTMKLC